MKTMRYLLHAALAAALLLGSATADAAKKSSPSKDSPTTSSVQKPAKFSKRVTKTVELNYLLYLPDDYETTTTKFPLVLFLHGAGERGNDLEKVKVHGPPKLIKNGAKFPFILVSPQCPEGKWWNMESLTMLLDDVQSRLRVDKSRIYVTGVSMGGYGTWELALTQPNRFAAIVPICGGGRPWMARLIAHMPVWAFHGAKDKAVNPRESEEMVAAINAAGGAAKLTIYPDATHDSWSRTYDNPEVFEWMLQQQLPPDVDTTKK